MINLFNDINTKIMPLPGWCSIEKSLTLASLVLGLRPKCVVELGVFGGRSFFPMAMAAKEVGGCLCHGIDPWKAAESAKGQRGDNLAWWGTLDHNVIFQNFMLKVNELGLKNCVRIHRCTSDEANTINPIDLLHADGNHGVQVIKDIQKFAPWISPGGIVVMDDLHWDGMAVSEAAKLLIKSGFAELYHVQHGVDDWAVYQKR